MLSRFLGNKRQHISKSLFNLHQIRSFAVDAYTPKSFSRAIPFSQLTIGVIKETYPGEKRVAQTPETVKTLVQAGMTVQVEQGAGKDANFSDELYEKAGAKIVSTEEAWKSQVILKIRPPNFSELTKLENRCLISLVYPSQNPDLVSSLEKQGATCFALDCIPRLLSRGQTFDVLSSQANIAGYRAVIEASNHFGRFFMGQMTAAGKVAPAKVLVLGGGVAGLSAIGTAKNMGAIVKSFDVRSAVKEQVESLGAEFLQVQLKESGEGVGGYAKEMSPEWHAAAREMLTKELKDIDIIVSTAQIPGKRAPILITKEMIQVMKPGSVTVDLAAESGGNIETTRPGECYVTSNGVKCIGYTDMASRLATTSSQLFANNQAKFLLSVGPHTTKDKKKFSN